MKSVKPGRGPSAMSAIGSAVAVVFGLFWSFMALSAGAPPFFALFGLLFVLMSIVQGIYHFKNATGKDRFSSFDMTDASEEGDPLQKMVQKAAHTEPPECNAPCSPCGFCPYCGTKASDDFAFCPKCGKKLPTHCHSTNA